MRDETLLIGIHPGFFAQPHFQCCERAIRAQPGLGDDHADRRDMRRPKPPSIHPSPATPIADPYQYQPADDKRDEREVKHEYCISQQLVGRFVTHGLPKVYEETTIGHGPDAGSGRFPTTRWVIDALC